MPVESQAVISRVEREVQFSEIGPGLTEELLCNAVRAGQERSLTCTAFNSKAGPGFTRWDSAVAKLREGLSEFGWKPDDTGNLPTAISPNGKWEIAVSSADSQTGRDGHDPRTLRTKGPETRARVHANQMSLADLYPTFPRIARAAAVVPERITCMLLYHVDDLSHEVRIELSIPDGFDDAGRVSSFKKRYPLETLRAPQAVLDDASELAEETEVPVERIANG